MCDCIGEVAIYIVIDRIIDHHTVCSHDLNDHVIVCYHWHPYIFLNHFPGNHRDNVIQSLNQTRHSRYIT